MINYIYYSCKLCKKKFNRIDEVEFHLGDVHKIFDEEELDKSYLIHFPPHDKDEVNE